MTVVVRILNPASLQVYKWAQNLGYTLAQAGGGVKTGTLLGFLARAAGNKDLVVVTVIDVVQYIMCPSGVRVPFGAGTAVSGGLLFPTAMRDLWFSGYTPAVETPKLPNPDIDKWRLAANAGGAFGGTGSAWAGAVSIQLSSVVPRKTGYEQTVQQRDFANVAGFYNASNPSKQRFVTSFWASTASASRQNTEANTGDVPIPNIHAGGVRFSTDYVDPIVPGWVTVPRATAEFSPSNPPGWANATGVWGRSYRVSRDSTGRVTYVLLARLFDDAVYDGAGKPYFEPGAAWLATAEVMPSLVDGEFQHTSSLLSSAIYQTSLPSRFRNPDSCGVSNGAHVLLHAEVVDNLAEPNVWAGGNTYTIVRAISASADDGAGVSTTTVSVDTTNDTQQSRHFYGGASIDGVTSVWLYPHYNDVPAESPTGLLRVLTSDGATATIADVVTPAQFQAPGWGIPAITGLVSNVGMGSLGFLVTLAPQPTSGSILLAPFDVTFCVYEPATGAVQVRGTICQATIGYVEGYPTAAGGIGAVTVVQRRVQDPIDTTTTEAVLLWSTNSGSNPPNGGKSFVGATYISYDSGFSWYSISDTVGDFRGAFFIGNDLRPVRPGSAWTK